MPLNSLSLTLGSVESNILLATTKTNYTLKNPAGIHVILQTHWLLFGFS
jgi:hypothetical protein